MSKWKIVLVLIAIFLAGAVTGGVLAARVISKAVNDRVNPERWPSAVVAMYKRKLKLTPDQIEKIKPAVEEGRAELRRVMGSAVRDYVGIMQRFDEQLKPILTEEQSRLHDEMREEFRNRLRQRAGIKVASSPE